MPNGNGNGVTVKLREKAEKILLSKHERVLSNVRKEHRALKKELTKKVIAEWEINKQVKELVKLKEKAEVLEDEIKGKLGSHHSYREWEDWKKGLFDGKKLEEEVEKRVKSKIDFDQEEERLNDLKDDLCEELWLAGQPDEVKDILSKMK